MVNLKLSQQWLADLTQVPIPALPDPLFLSLRAKMFLCSFLLAGKTNWSSLTHVRRYTPPELKIETAGLSRQLKVSGLRGVLPLGNQAPWNTLSVIVPRPPCLYFAITKAVGSTLTLLPTFLVSNVDLARDSRCWLWSSVCILLKSGKVYISVLVWVIWPFILKEPKHRWQD